MGGLNSICKQGKKRKKEKKISCLLASPALKARLPTSTSIHGAPTRLLNGNGNIRSAASDKTCVAAESVQGLNIFQQGRGVNDFAVYPNQILNNTKPVSTTTTTYIDLNF